MPNRGRAAFALLLVSLVSLAVLAGLWVSGESGEGRAAPADVGSLEQPTTALPAATRRAASAAPVRELPRARKAPVRSPATTAGRAGPSTRKVGAVPGVEVHDARVGEQLVEDIAPPARIRVPVLGVDATVRPMGIESNGEMELPVDPAEVGWYGYGPTPGEPGSAVVAGHVDGDGVPGAFFRIGELEPGERLTVTASDGSSRSFRVVARRTFIKTRLPAALIFRRTGRPVLTLVTCGGKFDRSTGHYESNVVVFATPI